MRAAANAAADAGLPLEARLEVLRRVPDPLGVRLVARHLVDQLADPATAAVAAGFIVGRIAVEPEPSPDEFTLLRRLYAEGRAPDDDAIASALGTPPTASAIAQISAHDRPAELVRPHRWLVAIPAEAAPKWHAADARLEPVLGVASRDGVMFRVAAGSFGAPGSPIAVEDLQALAPIDAAGRIAAWRPEPDASFMDPDAAGLAGAMRSTIDADPPRWLSGNLVALARDLGHPRYVGVLVDAVADHAGALPKAQAAVNLAELVLTEFRAADPAPETLADPDISWPSIARAAVKMLGRLGRLDDDAGDQAWSLLTATVAVRGNSAVADDAGEDEILLVAWNAEWTLAVESGMKLAAAREGQGDPRLLLLLDEMLGLDGRDGLLIRATLAKWWPWLRERAPNWFARNADRIFGDDATVDQFVRYAAPTSAILGEQRDRLFVALAREEGAVQHVLFGVSWRVPGYEPKAVASALAAAGAEALGTAAHWMGTAFMDVPDDVDATPIADLWRALLNLGLGAEAYKELGWLVINDRIDQEPWLDLMLATATAAGGNVTEPNRVAERAAQSVGDPRAASIITELLGGNPDAWDLSRIGDFGLAILPATTGHHLAELRERLLQRGFYEARDV
jgi:hypothetical protein